MNQPKQVISNTPPIENFGTIDQIISDRGQKLGNQSSKEKYLLAVLQIQLNYFWGPAQYGSKNFALFPPPSRSIHKVTQTFSFLLFLAHPPDS